MIAFLSPLFLIGALAAAIPIAIHLFHRRTDPVIHFAAMRYLRPAPAAHAHRRRLRELILLALRVTALALLAVAFARPYLSRASAAGGSPATVVMIDTSASVSAAGQIDRARDIARNAIRAAPADHQVAVVAFSGGADVVAPLSYDRSAALAAVDALKAGAGATRYAIALAQATALFGERRGRLVVITDLQQAGWDAGGAGGMPDRIRVDVGDVGTPAVNLAVASLRADGTDLVAEIRNYAPRDVRQQVTLALDGRVLGVVPVSIGAGAAAEARIALPRSSAVLQAPSRTVTATIADPDGYAADNVRYAMLDSSSAPAVLLVTASGHPGEAFYVQRALSIAEGRDAFRVQVIGGPSFSDLPLDALDEADVIAILATRGLERRGRDLLAEYVTRGGGLLLTAGPDVDLAILQGALKDVVRTTWRPRDPATLAFALRDERHPIFRPLSGVGTLGHVTFTRTATVAAPDGALTLARYSDGTPALVEERVGRGRVLAFASDLNRRWNDLPLQPAFVPFVHEMVRYLAAARPARDEYLVGELPGEPGMTPGVITLPRPAGAPRRAAINVDPRESNPARMTVEEFHASLSRPNPAASRDAAADTREQEDRTRLWQFALVAMIACLAAEGLLGRTLA